MSAKSKHVSRTQKPAPAPLRPEQEKLVRKLLIDGAPFEDVVLTLAAQGHRVPQHVVENYFRSNPELHALRAKRMVEVARRVRTETEDGDPEDVQFADAVIMTGLLRLNRSAAMLDVNDALRRKLESENLHLRERIGHLKAQNEIKFGKLCDARTRLISAQYEAARQKLQEMQQHLQHAKQDELSGPELAARIEEIYGLVEAPPVPPVGAPKTEE
jgi:hypothetical protein